MNKSRIAECAVVSLILMLQTVLILLRQCGTIDWDWILVLLPTILTASSYIILNALCFIIWLRDYGKDN